MRAYHSQAPNGPPSGADGAAGHEPAAAGRAGGGAPARALVSENAPRYFKSASSSKAAGLQVLTRWVTCASWRRIWAWPLRRLVVHPLLCWWSEAQQHVQKGILRTCLPACR